MKIKCFWEHNGNDTMLYATEYPGAFTRGKTLDEAVSKMPTEIRSYSLWCGRDCPKGSSIVEVTERKESDLEICDADSDAIFSDEVLPLTVDGYENMKKLALKSAADFLALYNSVPNKEVGFLPERKTFYGKVPNTADEMYEHTKNVNSYYFGEIGVDCDNDGDILNCRRKGFDILETTKPDFLENRAEEGSYGEIWSLKKAIRRFIWHDRIHAKAMYKMALKTFKDSDIPNVFCFIDI